MTRPKRALAPELVRIIACVVVVIAHADLSYVPTGVGAVAAFAGISVGFAIVDPRTGVFGKLAPRLLSPWVFWSVVYGVFLAAKCVGRGQPPFEFFEPWMIVGGTGVHLWYLPAILVVLLGINEMAKVRVARPAVFGAVTALLVAAAVVSWLPASRTFILNNSPPLVQWQLLFTAAVGGLVACPLLGRVRNDRVLLALALAGILGGTVAHVNDFVPGAAIALAGGGAALMTGVTLPGAPRAVVLLGSLTLGVYLLHPLVLSALKGVGIEGLPAAAIAAPVSFVLIWLARLIPWARTMIGA